VTGVLDETYFGAALQAALRKRENTCPLVNCPKILFYWQLRWFRTDSGQAFRFSDTGVLVFLPGSSGRSAGPKTPSGAGLQNAKVAEVD
jgi:hypothetical protein